MESLGKSDKRALDLYVLIGAIATSSFLLFIYLNYKIIQSDLVIIGVIQELLTIPSLLAQPVLLFFALKEFKKTKYKVWSYSFFSSLILTASIVLAWGSFFI